ncbi:MAG: hypothetical protein AAF604_09255 [Acidobacteriota bacterium]
MSWTDAGPRLAVLIAAVGAVLLIGYFLTIDRSVAPSTPRGGDSATVAAVSAIDPGTQILAVLSAEGFRVDLQLTPGQPTHIEDERGWVLEVVPELHPPASGALPEVSLTFSRLETTEPQTPPIHLSTVRVASGDSAYVDLGDGDPWVRVEIPATGQTWKP